MTLKTKWIKAKRISKDEVHFEIITMENDTCESEKYFVQKPDAFNKFRWQVLTENRANKNFTIDPIFPYVRGLLEKGYDVSVIIDHNGEDWYLNHRVGYVTSDKLQTVQFNHRLVYGLG